MYRYRTPGFALISVIPYVAEGEGEGEGEREREGESRRQLSYKDDTEWRPFGFLPWEWRYAVDGLTSHVIMTFDRLLLLLVITMLRSLQ